MLLLNKSLLLKVENSYMFRPPTVAVNELNTKKIKKDIYSCI
jgi:hypothetical protein